MSANLLDGRAAARELRLDLAARVAALLARGVRPRLEAIVASQDPASLAYVAMKRRWAEAAGMVSGVFEATERTSQAELLDAIRTRVADPAVHGILVQHPLPAGLDESGALLALGPEKDVDGITPASLGRLAAGLPGFRCATPLGIMRLLARNGVEIAGKRALVIGRSAIVGKPMALMLLEANATVTIAHSKTIDLPERCREADLLVAAVGRPELIQGAWIKPGAVVVDAGFNKVPGRAGDVGDVEFSAAAERASWITPVPGGVGPMTVATLLSNTVDAATSTL